MWSRFASGLYEPFGVGVFDGLVYVTCRNGIVRLHDLNDDGEADYYETLYADQDVSTFFHAFNFDLQHDGHGNWYYVKPGQYTDFRLPGAVMRISRDGRKSEVVCTGFRVPNGMGLLPDGRLTVSDNQGNWMPASKINIIRPDGFYGYVQNLEGIIRAAREKKIRVVLVMQPINTGIPVDFKHETIESLKEKINKSSEMNGIRSYTQYLLVKEMTILAEKYDLTLADPCEELWKDPAGNFIDEVHLTAEGNRRLAGVIAEAIKTEETRAGV